MKGKLCFTLEQVCVVLPANDPESTNPLGPEDYVLSINDTKLSQQRICSPFWIQRLTSRLLPYLDKSSLRLDLAFFSI